jgi:hypothetical protein
MYVPGKNIYQYGGAPVNTISSYISTYNSDLSTVSTLLGTVSGATYSQYSQLSLDQISAVISSLNQQITDDSKGIALITSHVQVINNDINKMPDGYQQKYNDALYAYTSTHSQYINISTARGQSKHLLSLLNIKISSLNSSSINLSSILESITAEYSTFMTGYLNTKNTIDTNINITQSKYDSYIKEYDDYNSRISMFNKYQLNENFIVAGGEGSVNTLAYSRDGITWMGLGRTIFNTRVNAVAYNGDIWVAVGYDVSPQNASIAYSQDGINWNQVAYSKDDIFEEGFGVAWNGTVWFAVGKMVLGNFYQNSGYSYDGKQWDYANIPLSEVYGIAWGNGMWIATGTADTSELGGGGFAYLYSLDDNWQKGSLPDIITEDMRLFTKAGRAAAWNGSLWIAVGEGTTTMLSSTDGFQWTRVVNSPFGPDGIGRSITWGNNMWVATGASAERTSDGSLERAVAFSTDGVNWTPIRIFGSGGGYSATYNGRVWAIAGDGSGRSLYTLKPENIRDNSPFEYDELLRLFDDKCITVANTNLHALCDISKIQNACDTISTINNISTNFKYYDINTLSSNIITEQTNLNLFSQVSTQFFNDNKSVIENYSTSLGQVLQMQRDPDAFMKLYGAYDEITSSANTSQYNLDVIGYYSQLDAGSQIFFTQKKAEVLSEVEEYRYAAREMNSFLGVLTAELKIQKLNLMDTINTYSFQIQIATNNNDLTTKSTLTGNRLLLVQVQTRMQAEIDAIAPLDDEYTKLDGIFQSEYDYKETYMNYRSSLYTYERKALQNSQIKAQIHSEYASLWNQMTTTIDSINTQISNRMNLLSTIKGRLDPVKRDLKNPPLNAYTLPTFPANFNYQQKFIPHQLITDTSVSDYAILPPIRF